jgi:hypothetical protein
MTIRKKTAKKGKIVIDLTGPDGNAFALMGMSKQWAQQLGLNHSKILDECMSGDYENLLAVMDKYFGNHVIFER